jgi:two-component system, NarL family, response regulator DevR
VTGDAGQRRPVRLVLAGGSAVERHALGELVGSDPSVTVVGESPSLRETVPVAGGLSPNVVLADVRLPDVEEVMASRALRTAARDVSLLFLTPHADFRTVAGLVIGAANGHVPKHLDLEGLNDAIRRAGLGHAVLDARVVGGMLEWFAARGLRRPELQGRRSPLTTYEAHLLTLIARGALDDELSTRIGRSPSEVREMLATIYSTVGDDPGFAASGNQLAELLTSP